MAPHDVLELTRQLYKWRNSDEQALDRSLPATPYEPVRIARRSLRWHSGDKTLTPAALGHEAYLRVGGLTTGAWTGRGHFHAFTAQLMRRRLVDQARVSRCQRSNEMGRQ